MEFTKNTDDKTPIHQNKELKLEKRLWDIVHVLKTHQITKGLTPKKLRSIFEDLGPTYVKLGQIMSMRSDILPENYCEELTHLRTEVKPLPFSIIRQILEQEWHRPVEEVITNIQETPLGSASIAQAHYATLKSGSPIVLKVQRPHIQKTMEEDIHLMRKALKFFKYAIGSGDLIDFQTILDELWKTTKEEMDFQKEASHLQRFYENQKEIVYVTCPKVISSLTTKSVLAMDYIDGIQIDKTNLLLDNGYDTTEIGRKVAENYCKQILEDGFFHADPHPGNIWISDGKIAWLDLGMTGELSTYHKEILKRAIIAILKNDMYELKNVLLAFGEAKERINHARLYSDIDDIVQKYMSVGFGNMDVGKLIEKLLDLVKSHKIAINPDITMLGRSMITMEGTLKICSPEVNMLEILSGHMSRQLLNEFQWKQEVKHKARLLYGSMDKSLAIPALLSDLLNITKNGQTKLNLEFEDSDKHLSFFQNALNRTILTLLSISLFLGSSILCLSDLSPKLFQMPWISFVGFFISALLMLWLLLTIFFRRKK